MASSSDISHDTSNKLYFGENSRLIDSDQCELTHKCACICISVWCCMYLQVHTYTCFVCMWVYVFVRECICLRVRIYICAYVWMVHVNVSLSPCIRLCLFCVYECISADTCTPAFASLFIRMCICEFMFVSVCICLGILRVYTFMHTSVCL